MIPSQFDKFLIDENVSIPSISKVNRAKFYLTQEEAIIDFNMFRDIMLYAYAGREYAYKKGVNFEDSFNTLQDEINQNDKIHIVDLLSLYHNVFKNRIFDNHLRFNDIIGGQNFTLTHNVYFTDLVVEKTNDSYTVIVSKLVNINVGDKIIVDEKYLFPTLSATNKQFYLIGISSWNEETVLNICCNGDYIPVPLHKSMTETKTAYNNVHFNLERRRELPVLTSTNFSVMDNIERTQFKDLGKSLMTEDILIWNLSNNGGGSSDYPMYFIEGLNGFCNDMAVAKLHSNIIDDNYISPPYYHWDFSVDDIENNSANSFHGQMILIMNSRTASSGENAIYYANSLKNVIKVGENTRGCGLFGNCEYYELPYTHMIMQVPNRIFDCGFEEGVGYIPDYWVDSKDVTGVVIRWILEKDSFIPSI